MRIRASKKPWYVAGLAFECSHCGRCCAGPEVGYVWVTLEQIDAIAEFLAMPAQQVRDKYVREVAGRPSLIEKNDNDCVFLVDDPARPAQKTCMIYPVRPTQCRTWPFWPSNLRSPRAWNSAANRCPGINRGNTFNAEQINERLGQTIE